MKVLVVGGAGYLGGAVVDLLLASEHQPRVYDALLYEECYRKPVDFVYGDVRDTERLGRELAWADAVVWLAAVVGDRACALNPTATNEINEKSVCWLANNFRRRVVFTSSCSVYGAQNGGALTENSEINPLSLYASTKVTAEGHLRGKNAIIFRLGTLFGVGDTYCRLRLDLVVNTFVAQAFREGRICIHGGNQFRPLLHVCDAARAVMDGITSSHTGLFNLHRQNVRIGDLAFQVRNHFPDLAIETIDVALRDSRNYRVSSEKAQTRLGFRPTRSLDEGIEQVKDLLESNRLKQLDNPRYANDRFLASAEAQAAVATRDQSSAAISGGNGHGPEVGPPAVPHPSDHEKTALAA
ncbi:MAG: NAD-dependent epimerase/dehydratase family protein [Chlamydiota bacterium]